MPFRYLVFVGTVATPTSTLGMIMRLLAAATILAIALPLAAGAQPETPPVDVATPKRERIVDYDIFTGRFEAEKRVEIRARVSGYLDQVNFEEGEIVAKGDLLFVIDQRPFKVAVEQAEARVSSAKATRDLAKIEFERADQLRARNVGTEQEADRTAAALAEAEAQVLVAQSELNQANLELGFTEINAPFSGRISDAKVDVGNLITGGAQGEATLLAVLVKTDPIYFSFTASEADYLRYARLAKSGDRPSSRTTENPVSIRLMDEDEFMHRGHMDFVDNELDPNSGTIEGRALIPNPDGYIVPGLFGRIRLPASGEYEALLLPDKAILSDQARKIVMTVDGEGKVSPKPVIPGALYRGLRVIREGLEPEDRVVVAGIQRARPGSTVQPQDTELEFPEPPPGTAAEQAQSVEAEGADIPGDGTKPGKPENSGAAGTESAEESTATGSEPTRAESN